MKKPSGVKSKASSPLSLTEKDSNGQTKWVFLKLAAFIILCFLVLAAVLTIIYPLMPWESPLSKLPLFQFAEKTEPAAEALNAQGEAAALSSAVSTIDLWITEAPLGEETAAMVKTPIQAIEASITPAPTLSFKPTKAPTFTPAPTAAEPILQPTTLSNTYRPQPGSPLYLHLDKSGGSGGGCDALYLVGQVFNDQSLPQVGLTIVVEGEVASKPYRRNSETGSAPQYGPGGYEILLANQPFESKNSLFVQVVNQEGKPLSPKVPFDTYSSCEKNMIVINFVQK